MSHRRGETRTARRSRTAPARGAEQLCPDLLDRCRTRGIRITPQRLAVYRELARDSSHPTAEALFERLRPGMASLSLATVYRILEFLEREQLVRRVSTTDAAGRFDANLTRHHHLVCRSCGKMTDIEEQFLVQPAFPRTVLGAFRAEELDVRILGTCQACRRESSRPQPKSRATRTKPGASRPRNGGR